MGNYMVLETSSNLSEYIIIRDIFDKYGYSEPSTYEEFEAICAELKENGELPLMLDDLDQRPGYHYEGIWLNAFAG